jgi:hypothetical protein
MEHPERECVTCGQKGHWYTDCPKAPFGLLMAAAFGVASEADKQRLQEGLKEIYDDPESGLSKAAEMERAERRGEPR